MAAARQALELLPSNPDLQNALAWMLAITPQSTVRDGSTAMELATAASTSRGGKDLAMLRTVAAAYARAGDFPSAVQAAREGLQVAVSQFNGPLAGALNRDIQLYESGRPLGGLQ